MPLTMPNTPGFVESNFYIEENVRSFRSPFNNSIQRTRLTGGRWMATYSLPRMKKTDALLWLAFFMKLEGQTNTFYAHDPERVSVVGEWSGSGTPLVNGGSQTGSSLVTDGWDLSTDSILKAGDLFVVNSELKMVTDDVDSDESGNATINFKPALRNSPADNAALTLSNCSCTMIVTQDDISSWPTDRNGIYLPKSFSAVEPLS